jgi:hypothetical protein
MRTKARFAWLIVTRSSSIFGERDITFESNVGIHKVEELGLGVDSVTFTGTKTLWRQSMLLANFDFVFELEFRMQILRDYVNV